MSYRAARPALSQTRRIRDLEFQFYRWPGAAGQPLLLLHGWGDTGETFQFVADHLPPDRTLVAFDARGFGRTQWPREGYWFPDYLADLDAIFDWLSADEPLDLVGHSMGGNVALLYAGIRPQRVRRVVSLEGFGMPRTVPEQAPARYREWLEEIRGSSGSVMTRQHGTYAEVPQGTTQFASYDDFAHFTAVLRRRHPRTPAQYLDFIARSWGRERADGRIELRADPRHKRVNPVLYQREQAEACWREIAAPVWMVAGDQSEFAKRAAMDLTPAQLAPLFRDVNVATVTDAGHMLHHERPLEVAQLIQRALASSTG